MTVFRGTAGDDNLTGTSGNDEFILWQGGKDTVDAGAGNDVMRLGNALTAADQLDGGSGRDAVILNGDYSAGLVLGATTIANVEVLGLVGGHSYNLTTNDGNVAAGEKLIVQANGLGAGDTLTFDGSAESDGRFYVVAGAGDATITGGAQNDVFHLEQGGSDTAHGGGGNDAFYMGTNLWSDDQIDGGAGYDKVFASGFAGGDAITFNSTTMQGVEDFVLSGSSLGITIADATVAAGAAMIIDASAVNGFTFDGSAETDGRFYVIAGAGNDTLTGGAKHDVFDLSHGGNDTAHGGGGNDTFNLGAAFTAADTIDGGAGNDTVNINPTGGINNITFTATTLTNVENLTITSDKQIHIFTNDANVASGATLTVDFSASAGILGDYAFDGSAETDGHFAIIGPADAEFVRFTGGAQSDTFTLGNDDTPDNTINGGGGDDTLTFTAFGGVFVYFDGGSGNDTMALIGGGADTLHMTSVETVKLDDSSYSLTELDDSVAPGATLTVDASALTASHSLTFNGSDESDGNFVFKFAGGFTASDSLTGGAGNDTLVLNGDYSGSVAFGAATITSIETITVADGHSYQLISNDNNVGSGDTLTVDGSALTGTNALIFNGFAETDGHFAFTGGAGNDDFHGGAQSDTFDFTHGGADTGFGGGGDDTFSFGGTFDANDFVDGGGDSDTLSLNGDYSTLTTITLSNVENIETLQLLGAANSYNLAVSDGITGGSTLTVDASAAASLTFDASGATATAYTVTGSAGNDTLTGGALADTFDLSQGGSDTVTGGAGGDTIIAHAGSADTFVFSAVADSSSINFDTINNVDFGTDRFEMSSLAPLPSAIDTAITTGHLDAATFDSDLSTDVWAGNLAVGHAVLFTADSGDFTGHTFLVVDINFIAGYQNGSDLVIDVTGFTGTLTTGDFI